MFSQFPSAYFAVPYQNSKQLALCHFSTEILAKSCFICIFSCLKIGKSMIYITVCVGQTISIFKAARLFF